MTHLLNDLEMTKDEAIYILKNTAWLGGSDNEKEAKVWKAVEFACKAMENYELIKTCNESVTGGGGMSKKIFISQPMKGLSIGEILEERKRIAKMFSPEYEVIDSLFEGPGSPLKKLGMSIQKMDDADIVVFAPNWKHYMGCKLEFIIAKEYGKEVVTFDGLGEMDE